ncbi:hypothetical protein [Saccharothrix xinjiangensis]|uniref:Uncharacterized protein n=1 Tax=Saccharothrix xinjiangensis TaxID=204798 RepID=A0ABV9XYY2_9PSEU
MSDDTTEVLPAATACLVLPALVGVAAGWPVWVVVAVVCALLATTAAVIRQRRYRRGQRALLAEHLDPGEERVTAPPPPPEVEPQEWEITPVTLPSAVPDYRFTFGCVVRWSPRPHGFGHAAPDAVAADAVIRRARSISARCHPEDDGAVHAVAAALGEPEADPGQHVLAWATDVRLDVAPEDREHLRREAEVRKRRHAWEQEVAAERAVRAYLGEEVLTSTGSAVVWWLARNTDEVRETVDLIGTLARLSAAAGDREVGRFPEHPGGTALDGKPFAPVPFGVNGSGVNGSGANGGAVPCDDLLPAPDDDRALFGSQLADLLERHDEVDRAHQARYRYGVPDLGAEEPWPFPPPERPDDEPRDEPDDGRPGDGR